MVLEGVEVNYVSFSGSKISRTIRFLKECIRQSFSFGSDLLIVTYFNFCFLLPVICKSKKTILDIRTGSLKENNVLRFIDNYIVLIQSFFFGKIIILSESLRKKLHISAKKSNIVPLGSEIFFIGDHLFNTFNLIYVGTLDDRYISKTIEGLQLFMQNFESTSIKISYTIIGFGSDNEISKIQTSISDNKLTEIVKYEGRKNYNEMIPYFEKSNIGVVFVPQTPWYDCQPVTKLFEYMLSGMPVIATNTYENRLIVNDSNGVLINDTPEDFCNGLKKIYQQRNSYNSAQIRKSVENYTWEKIVNGNLKPYLLGLLKNS
jgi:glycosyltransferase involved in cell wall biosynthesis